MTINQCAPGCGLGRSGEGAAVLFSKGKIDFLLGGGGDGTAFILRPGGQIQLLHLVASVTIMTIKQRTGGVGLKRPGDGVAATLFEGIWEEFFVLGGASNTNNLASGRSN